MLFLNKIALLTFPPGNTIVYNTPAVPLNQLQQPLHGAKALSWTQFPLTETMYGSSEKYKRSRKNATVLSALLIADSVWDICACTFYT
jgi:hypothetical protein